MKKEVSSKDLQKALAEEVEILVREEKDKLIKRALKRLRNSERQ